MMALVQFFEIPMFDDDGCTYVEKIRAFVPIGKSKKDFLQSVKDYQRRHYSLYELRVVNA